MAVFELNNEINNLRVEENIEIERILKDYTELFAPIVNEIENNIRIIGRLDFIFANAKYSLSIDGNQPIINDEKQLNLRGARHPLIDKNKVDSNRYKLRLRLLLPCYYRTKYWW